MWTLIESVCWYASVWRSSIPTFKAGMSWYRMTINHWKWSSKSQSMQHPPTQQMLLHMQKYDYTIQHKCGKEMALANHLSHFSSHSNSLPSQSCKMSSMSSYLMLNWKSFEALWNATQCIAPSIASPLEVGPTTGSKSLRSADTSGEPMMNWPLMLAYSSRGQGSSFPQNCLITPLQTCMEHIKGSTGCKLRWEVVYQPSIDAYIVDYVCQCTICTKRKASPPAQPMFPRDIPDGPWQEITADYLAHKGRVYLLVCNLFSKYPLPV